MTTDLHTKTQKQPDVTQVGKFVDPPTVPKTQILLAPLHETCPCSMHDLAEHVGILLLHWPEKLSCEIGR